MPDITLIQHDGREHGFEAPDGVSLMHAAVGNDIPGIVGECGGMLRCSTCHVIVDEAWRAKLPPASEAELSMLEFTAQPRNADSRLACQILLGPDLQGLRVNLPATQY